MAEANPLWHLKKLTKSYPNMSSWVGTCLKNKGKGEGPDWPNWCFMPMAAWAALIQLKSRAYDPYTQQMIVAQEVGVLSAIGTWRYSQGIYRFDEDLLAALADSDLSGNLPSNLFRRLPEWCVYIETPGLSWRGSELFGFWAHLEWDFNEHREELRLVLNTKGGMDVQPLHIGQWTIEVSLQKAFELTQINVERSPLAGLLSLTRPLVKEVRPLISILLYLCSDMPDFDPLRMPKPSPHRPALKKGKKGFYLYTPERSRVCSVGERVGSVLREANNEAQASNRTVNHWIAPLIVEGKKVSSAVADLNVEV